MILKKKQLIFFGSVWLTFASVPANTAGRIIHGTKTDTETDKYLDKLVLLVSLTR